MKRICGQCKQEFERSSGPMVVVCTPCLNKPKPPPDFIEKNGLWIPNPEARA